MKSLVPVISTGFEAFVSGCLEQCCCPNTYLDRAVDLQSFSLEPQDEALVLACCGVFEVEGSLQAEPDVYTIDLVQTKALGSDLVDVVFGG